MRKYIIKIFEKKDNFRFIYETAKFGRIGFSFKSEIKNNYLIKLAGIEALAYIKKFNLKTDVEYENFFKNKSEDMSITEEELKKMSHSVIFHVFKKDETILLDKNKK